MKIIDILNKMANGTLEDGFKFCFEDEVYTYTKEDNSIRDNSRNKIGQRKAIEKYLNEEVLLFKENNQEVIEENKEIEELGFIEETVKYCDGTGHTNTEPASAIDMHKKINELVRAVNKINKEREEMQNGRILQ